MFYFADVKYSNTGHAQQVSIVDLSLPNIAIQGTGSATAYLQGMLFIMTNCDNKPWHTKFIETRIWRWNHALL
jgi:hypothetical protein